MREDPGRRDALRARFEREAQVTAALASPHTVSLYDYGISDEGELHYAMEPLDGISLPRAPRPSLAPMPAWG